MGIIGFTLTLLLGMFIEDKFHVWDIIREKASVMWASIKEKFNKKSEK